jgi:hypothetical protein
MPDCFDDSNFKNLENELKKFKQIQKDSCGMSIGKIEDVTVSITSKQKEKLRLVAQNLRDSIELIEEVIDSIIHDSARSK